EVSAASRRAKRSRRGQGRRRRRRSTGWRTRSATELEGSAPVGGGLAKEGSEGAGGATAGIPESRQREGILDRAQNRVVVVGEARPRVRASACTGHDQCHVAAPGPAAST